MSCGEFDIHFARAALKRSRIFAFSLAPSMRIALADLKPGAIRAVYPGQRRYTLAKRVEVAPLAELLNSKGISRKVSFAIEELAH